MSKVFNFIPNIGVGPFKFNMLRNELRKEVEKFNFIETDSGFPPDNLVDVDFIENTMFIEYNKSNECVAVELAFGQDEAKPFFDIVFKQQKLFDLNFEELVTFLKQYDDNLEIDAAGLTSFKLGLGSYCPEHIENPKAKLESLIVFKEGYYDD